MTNEEIIKAAFKVWGRDFYRKTSLSSLARELGVSKPALYRHFENKQALTAAMLESFCDDFAASIRGDFELALGAADADEGFFTILQSIAGYFARNVYAMAFSLVNIYEGNIEEGTISHLLNERGINMSTIRLVIEKKYNADSTLIKLIFATLTFYMANFHRTNKSFENPPSDEQIKSTISSIFTVVENGFGFSAERINALDFEKLEKMIDGTMQSESPEPLFKAVAKAVAEAGPWGASMDMVAKNMGLSKSSLYGHFKNKKDMLRRLFMIELKRIIEYARQSIKLSGDTAERLYLVIYSTAVYLRSRPEILVAVSWIRTRRLDLSKPEKITEIYRLIEDMYTEPVKNWNDDEKMRISYWILFLLITILTKPHLYKNNGQSCPVKNQNSDIRLLYKFITLGLGGFNK